MSRAGNEPSSQIKYIFQGNIVVPTRNPFDGSQQEHSNSAENEYARWIGPGLKILLNHVLCVALDGIISHLGHESDSQEILLSVKGAANNNKVEYTELSQHEFLCPGFIDLHIHAPQYSYAGTATDRPLMGRQGWLETYTFPAERSLKNDLDRAKQVYSRVVRSTLNTGTTTAVYFATLHIGPCKLLVDTALDLGQRALVGKVCMDRNCPQDYCQSTLDNTIETRALIEYIHNKAGRVSDTQRKLLPLILPVVTPRFIPTCSPQLMTALGEIAQEYDCHIHSHLSESVDEVEFSRCLDVMDHNLNRTDAEVFDSHGLLGKKSILAHAVHMTDSDMDLVKVRQSAVAHCPLSNFYFAGGILQCRRLLRQGVKVGLGTDVAGGYSTSLLNSARMAVVASRSLQQQQVSGTNVALDYRHAFYLATLGGAEALGLQTRIGTLAVGMEFDAVVLSADIPSPIHVFDSNTLEDVFQKICTLGDDRNVKHVYVQGKRVK